jgi:hypothetical protein
MGALSQDHLSLDRDSNRELQENETGLVACPTLCVLLEYTVRGRSQPDRSHRQLQDCIIESYNLAQSVSESS